MGERLSTRLSNSKLIDIRLSFVNGQTYKKKIRIILDINGLLGLVIQAQSYVIDSRSKKQRDYLGMRVSR